MERPFIVGDKIRCIESAGSLKFGNDYIVSKTETITVGQQFIWVEKDPWSNPEGYGPFVSNRFELQERVIPYSVFQSGDDDDCI